jgi:dihydropteroate synthase
MNQFTFNIKGILTEFNRPQIMGILNLTPDSFFDGGKYSNESQIIKRCEDIIAQGADFIDIGAVSTRPGAAEIDEKQELARLLPALKIINKYFPQALISVDTFRAKVAEIAILEFGAAIINDITAGNGDDLMFKTIAQLNVPYVMMHISGNPQNMQNQPYYQDVVKEIQLYFAKKIQKAHSVGINDIIIDPGFGFGKTIDHNYEILQNLNKFRITSCPILVGLSRKSMIYKLLDSTPADALNGTSATNMIALLKGADILRVHDVKETLELVKIYTKMMQFENVKI